MSPTILPVEAKVRQVKGYISELFSEEPLALRQCRENSIRKGLKNIHVTPSVGKTLYLLAMLQKPQRILELGTLGGYSALWLARALPEGGTLFTIESDPLNAAIARENIQLAQEIERIHLIEGKALDKLNHLTQSGEKPFDFVFVDADKMEYDKYLEKILALVLPGSVIIHDNLIPKRHHISVPDPRDNEAIAIYAFNHFLAEHPRLETQLFPVFSDSLQMIDALGVSTVLPFATGDTG